MNPLLLFERNLLLLALLAWISPNSALAQTAINKDSLTQHVLAITSKGNIIRAPAGLKVQLAVVASSLTLQIRVENSHTRAKEVLIHLRDGENRIIHRIRSYKAVFAARINMSGLQGGSYQVEVANRYERYYYELQIETKKVRSMEINPQAFLNDPTTS